MAVDFKTKQLEFTQYIRDPAKNPAPADVKPERMAMYRELMFNNIENFLASNFPVIRKLLDDQQWLGLVQDFFAKHRSETPYFSEIAEEFLGYLQNERDNPDDFPFLLELAHYEWVEMALAIAKDEISPVYQLVEVSQDCLIRLSPLAWLLAYQYPVHLISPEFLPNEPTAQPTCLVAYRNQGDEVKFMEINPMTYRLLEIVQEKGPISTKACLQEVAQEFKQIREEVLFAGGMQLLNDLASKQAIRVGSYK